MTTPSGFPPPPPGYPQLRGGPDFAGGHPGTAQWPAPPPPAPPRSRRGPLLLGLLLGLVVAVGVGAVLVATGTMKFGGATAGPDTRPIILPAEIDGMTDARSLTLPSSVDRSMRELVGQLPEIVPRAEQDLSRAYGGASAKVQAYADPDLSKFVLVEVVRGDSPGLTVIPTSAAGGPTSTIIRREDVECLVLQIPQSSGSKARTIPTVCQRSGGGLTVRVLGNDTFGGDDGVNDLFAATDAFYNGVG